MGKPCATGYYQWMRTHANPCFDPPTRTTTGIIVIATCVGSRLSDCATHPLKLMNWNDPWDDDGIKDASTMCGIQWLIPTMALYICGSMVAYECMNADANNAISTDMYFYSYTALFPLDASQSLAISSVEFSTLLAMP
jgi:hypothetical protein